MEKATLFHCFHIFCNHSFYLYLASYLFVLLSHAYNNIINCMHFVWMGECYCVAVTLRTTGLPSLMSWASIMATLWSMVVEWSVLSAEFPTNVPRANTAAHLTCSDTNTVLSGHSPPALIKLLC